MCTYNLIDLLNAFGEAEHKLRLAMSINITDENIINNDNISFGLSRLKHSLNQLSDFNLELRKEWEKKHV